MWLRDSEKRSKKSTFLDKKKKYQNFNVCWKKKFNYLLFHYSRVICILFSFFCTNWPASRINSSRMQPILRLIFYIIRKMYTRTYHYACTPPHTPSRETHTTHPHGRRTPRHHPLVNASPNTLKETEINNKSLASLNSYRKRIIVCIIFW